MNLKEFFKPTKNKIILFIIIAIIGEFLLLPVFVNMGSLCALHPNNDPCKQYYYPMWESCGHCGLPTTIDNIKTIAIYSFYPLANVGRIIAYFLPLFGLILNQALAITYWYLLSCVLIFIYNKIFNKDKPIKSKEKKEENKTKKRKK
jgi:hypothetical protein